mmetsp:Transcript_12116/g.31159  ORF Transcript_12116/g.31159 Transcript_12116/m.31159 type:complete len:151 (-) Transcript_12116:103-555(-)|eukprot:CAMPEP_0182927608 /NCGR_PEP_ID=MMETSP0105_2-20130417/13876_1 /TAXON_ID=81532 ORGANISM="Acanthoeca-like sp., Strain 10tr" /NCGR_SAMPLE_ID=MMETSP0105_2 /ASSEMBLY_ACC=CAM_ASM_000205 /LENGTH=150 /DNA_ID=CAMNT_0025065563 /DNA_START=28 /DNA_END=480 /DNA_ORIENTATION=+
MRVRRVALVLVTGVAAGMAQQSEPTATPDIPSTRNPNPNPTLSPPEPAKNPETPRAATPTAASPTVGVSPGGSGLEGANNKEGMGGELTGVAVAVSLVGVAALAAIIYGVARAVRQDPPGTTNKTALARPLRGPDVNPVFSQSRTVVFAT